MKEILLTEKEMVFLVLLCIHAFYNQQAIYKSFTVYVKTCFQSCFMFLKKLIYKEKCKTVKQ